MDFASMLPVLLPIALFVVTLIIIFTLRSSDKHSKSLSNVKRLLDIYKGNIEASDLSFKQYASELEQTVAKKDAEVKSLIQTVNTQITELKSYSDDLLRLKAAMETYRTALEGLGVLTKDADDKVRMESPEIFRVLGKRRPSFVLPYIEKLKKMSETDENRVVRIHSAGALRAITADIR